MVEYFGCCLDARLRWESMEMKALMKINTKLRFFAQNYLGCSATF